jgi:hypothetical protein
MVKDYCQTDTLTNQILMCITVLLTTKTLSNGHLYFKGKGEESFSPKFNYKGFQYVEVNSSEPIELLQNSVKGYFMHSDVPAIGKITSSNPTLNKMWAATNRSYLSNLFGYPTDCPQREKMAGQAMPILPVKQDFIILMALQFTRNGSPITATNNSPMAYFHQLFRQVAGVMNGAMDRLDKYNRHYSLEYLFVLWR